MTPTTPENLALINSVFDKVAEHLQYLACRWLDESEYEDINEYQKSLQSQLPSPFTIVKMTKRPFGCQFKIGTDAVYSMSATTRSVQWKRVA